MALDFISWKNSGSPSGGRSAEGGYGGGFSNVLPQPDRGIAALGLDLGINAWNAANDNGNANTGYPYGGYGSGGGKSAAELQEEQQKQLDNTIANYRKRKKDLDDLVADGLNNIKKQIEQNQKLYKKTQTDNMLQLDWQPQQQREQSTLMALRNRMGNAAWGSSLVDLAEGMGRVDDMADVELINTHKQNEASTYNDYIQADSSLKADYQDQVNAGKDEQSKLYSQLWSTLANIDANAGSQANMEAIARGETVNYGEGTDAYTLQGAPERSTSPELQEMYNIPELEAPKMQDYIRSDKGETSYNVNENAGNANRSTVANTAFNDNLSAFRNRTKENKWDTVKTNQ